MNGRLGFISENAKAQSFSNILLQGISDLNILANILFLSYEFFISSLYFSFLQNPIASFLIDNSFHISSGLIPAETQITNK